MTYADAQRYVGTNVLSGWLQASLLWAEGCEPNSRVLEIGCGALHLAGPLVLALKPGNYLGVDPNEWLRTAARRTNPALDHLLTARSARFQSANDFHVKSGEHFDYVFAHSVLSHVTRTQLSAFMYEVGHVLAPGGKLIASFREGPEDSTDEEWVYPGVTYFTMRTVREAGAEAGLKVRSKSKLRSFYTRLRPEESHDWIVATW